MGSRGAGNNGLRLGSESPIVEALVMDAFFKGALLVLSLAGLEILLSVDNAVVLAVMAKNLKPEDQKKALRYGMAGAFVFRFLMILIAAELVKYEFMKILGGVYLLWVWIHYFLSKNKGPKVETKSYPSFWKTVFAIELTDLVFAIDSILAAFAITSNIWVIILGSIIGIIGVRFAAGFVIKILQSFPALETLAYLLIGGVAIKVVLEGTHHSFW